MTNAEVYIGDEDLIDQFIDEFNEFACKQDCNFEYHYLKETLVRFFKQERKLTLTEDERVILRNMIPQVKTIGRDTDGELIIKICSDTIAEDFCYSGAFIYDHLFQFIKERRRILY